MLSPSDPAISYALTKVRYQVPPWLYLQRIESKNYDEVISLVLELCCANGLPLDHSNLIEPECKTYFKEHGFFNLVFTTRIKSGDIPIVSLETLKELHFLGEKYGGAPDIENKKSDARSLLFGADENAQCFLKAALIPYGGPIKDRPEAVMCVDACLTNVANIWNMRYFDTHIQTKAPE